MRFSEYYRGIVAEARMGGPTPQEARQDYRRNLEARLDAIRVR
jgi:hypothetical protein